MDSYLDKVYIHPTDSIWGIGAAIYSQLGQQNLHQLKDITESKPHSILFPSVETFKTYFDLPQNLNEDVLFELLKYEITFLMSLSYAKKAIPKWVTYDSPFVGVRIVLMDCLMDLWQLLQQPWTSTSINKTGQMPCQNFEEVLSFKQHHPTDLELLPQFNSSHTGSGHASTILKIKPFEVVRQGENYKFIKDHATRLFAT